MTEFKTPKRHLLFYEEIGVYEEVYTSNIRPYLDGRTDGPVIEVTGDYQHEINATGAPF